MVPILSLWLPILVSAVLVFVLSSIIHMVLGYHASDYRRLPDEAAAAAALRGLAVPDGNYALPKAASMKEMSSAEYQAKVRQGPNALLTIWNTGNPSLGKQLGLWFAYSLLVGIVAAYVTGRALGPGAHYLEVFRFAGTTAFACYAIGELQRPIWWRQPWSVTFKSAVDGLVYALFTAGAFGWLWPSA